MAETAESMRAFAMGHATYPASVERYLESKLGDARAPVRAAMQPLASSFPADELEANSFHPHEQFRLEVPQGEGGWAPKGLLGVERIRALRQG